MNEEVILSEDRVIEVYRGAEQLQSGAEYVSGETLTVKISDTQKEYVFEAWGGAKFTGGGCEGRRIANKPSAEIVMPTTSPEDGRVKIAAAWAPGHVAVRMSRDFVLVSADASAQQKLQPADSAPDASAQEPEHPKEEPVHDLLSDLQASIAQQEARKLQQQREDEARMEMERQAAEAAEAAEAQPQEEEGASEAAQPGEAAEQPSAAQKVRDAVLAQRAQQPRLSLSFARDGAAPPEDSQRETQRDSEGEGEKGEEKPVYRDMLGEQLESRRAALRGGAQGAKGSQGEELLAQQDSQRYTVDRQGRKVLADDDAQLSDFAKKKKQSLPHGPQRKQRKQQLQTRHRLRQLGIIAAVVVAL
eukprot:gene40683-49602_t